MKCPCPKALANPAEFVHTIVIQDYTMTQDTAGQPVRSYFTFATARAKVEPLRGYELFRAQGIVAETTTRFTMYYKQGLSASMRILFLGVYYNIVDVIDIEMRHLFHELMCSSGLADEA